MTSPHGPLGLSALLVHELEEPLATMASGVELLRCREGADRDETLAIVERSLRRAREVLRRLRSLHLDEGALAAQRRPTDLVALARATVAELEPTTLAEHPTRVEAADATRPCDVDPGAIRQALGNLLVNAARYSPPGQPIVVDVRYHGDRVRLTVRDRGSGVAPEDAERIFGLWERGDGAHPGLGVGLYLARRIARAHGGDVRLEPADEQGAVFSVELPCGASGQARSRPEGRTA